MESLLSLLGTGFDLLLVVLGFSLIVFIHEAGHFIAARWAGIRVYTFALGFGPAVASWRKGMGFRRGSSEREYFDRLSADATLRVGGSAPQGSAPSPAPEISPTEYRLNWLPLGGYVRMLGQDDLDPTATSAATDSYQNCAVWKRMIVISAGVVANIITAAIMFVLVFLIGLKTEPAKIGDVDPGSPAAVAQAINADLARVSDRGLRPGDEVLAVNGGEPNSFNDIVLATAMSRPGEPVNLRVRRAGVETPLEFAITPRQSTTTKLLDIGVGPASSASIAPVKTDAQLALAKENLAKIGLAGVEPGMTLVRIGVDERIGGAHELDAAVRASGGRPVEVEFAGGDGRRVTATLTPRAELQADLIPRSQTTVTPQRHLLGLTPVMKIREAGDGAIAQGLKSGDVFARIGSVEYPSVVAGMSAIRAAKGTTIPVTVLRTGDDGVEREIDLAVQVSGKGQIGFFVGETDEESSLLALPPEQLRGAVNDTLFRPAAFGVITTPGTRIRAVNAIPTRTLSDVRDVLRTAAISALAETQTSVKARLTLELPRAAGSPAAAHAETLDVDWVIGEPDLRVLSSLTWTSSAGSWMFEPEQKVLRGDGPIDALSLGLSETNRVMATTYLTFARLFQGTVKVEHLKGPVGIAHIGTRLVDRGLVWLVFFMALISVNLAVINFLPMPIVDGGQFILLLIEQIRGKPVPVGVQNGITMAGLVMVGSMFLVVTFNDIRGLLGM
jgi:regulator of sigma E protease